MYWSGVGSLGEDGIFVLKSPKDAAKVNADRRK